MNAEIEKEILNKSVDMGYLYDWYIASVTGDPPVWTEEHLQELLNDFILIPKENLEEEIL